MKKIRILSLLILAYWTFVGFTNIVLAANNLWDYYNGNLPSLEQRGFLAIQAGIQNYKGTKEQNIKLLSFLQNGNKLGFNVVSAYRTNLSSSITSSQTTIPVGTVTTKDGHVLTMTDLGSVAFLTIESGSLKEEIVMCTGISSTTWTGCTRGLAFYGTSTTSVSANQKNHNSGSSVIMSNVQYVYKQFTDKDTNETIGGLKTFSSIPLIPTTIPTLGTQIASKTYVDSVSFNGSPNGSETVKGIWQGATQSDMPIGTTLGSTGASLILQNKYATSTPSATTTIPITGTNGKLSQSFLDLTQPFTFSNATTTISGTLNASTSTFSGAIANSSLATSTFAGDLFGGGFFHQTAITATSTWAVPTSVKKVKIRMVGAGGNGGNCGSNGQSSGGGGGGGYAEKLLDVSATSTLAIGFTSGTSTVAISGVTQVSATKGFSTTAAVGYSAGGLGGVGISGDVNINGYLGGYGIQIPTNGTPTIGGKGGDSLFGAGAQEVFSSSSSGRIDGNNGNSYGGGGSGCIDKDSTGSGGLGALGIVIIQW